MIASSRHAITHPRQLAGTACTAAIAFMVAGSPQLHAERDVEDLEREVEALRERLNDLEARLSGKAAARTISEEPVTPADAVDLPPDPTALSEASPGTERSEAAITEPVQPDVELGGALRFNVVHRNFEDASQGKRGESGLDVFRLNVDGQLSNILISAEWRFYSFMNTIHHGWVGYEFSDKSQLQLGIHQVPFGLLPFASHNSWFGMPYYVGFADEYDMGIKYMRHDGPWATQLGFYKNEELNDATDLSRYGFDLVRVDDEQNEEINRINARTAYTFARGTGCETEVGVSGQVAEIFNVARDRRGDHWAAGLHLDSRCGRWNLQLQGSRYEYDPPGPSQGSVRAGAFATSYDIADEAYIAVANLAYNFDSPWPAIEQVTCYNDYSRLIKDPSGFRDSEINTLGCAIGSGPLFTYVDYILAKNMAFFADGSLAGGGENEWRRRLNINIGYYW